MIKNNDPYLVEFNVRMGDPECQVILPNLKTDLVKIFKKVVSNKLKKIKINWIKQKSMTIVLCSKGYPGSYKKGKLIEGISKIFLSKKDYIFHAGTKLEKNKILSNGGRVLNIVSTGNNFSNIRKRVIKILNMINWKNGFFRKDIGWRVIEKNANNKW